MTPKKQKGQRREKKADRGRRRERKMLGFLFKKGHNWGEGTGGRRKRKKQGGYKNSTRKKESEEKLRGCEGMKEEYKDGKKKVRRMTLRA